MAGGWGNRMWRLGDKLAVRMRRMNILRAVDRGRFAADGIRAAGDDATAAPEWTGIRVRVRYS